MSTIDETRRSAAQNTLLNRPGGLHLSQSTGRFIGKVFTYTLLTIGAAVMFFPMFWMLTASLKPEWQILTEPISIPSEWVHVQAGNTVQELPLWNTTNPAGEQEEVITIGTRRYTTVIDLNQLTEDMLISAPADALGETQPTEVGNVVLNVRTLTREDGSQIPVASLARDGGNILVAPVEALTAVASRMALAEVNAGERVTVEVGDASFKGRQVSDGPAVLALGPESELTIVGPKAIAEQAILVPAEVPVGESLVPIGNTELLHYSLQGYPADEYYVQLSSETWQPVIDLSDVNASAFAVENARLSEEVTTRTFNLAAMPVRTLTGEDGSQAEVVVLIRTAATSLVIPVEDAGSIRLSPISRLAEPFVLNIGGIPVRYRDDYVEHGEEQSVAIVGERLNMSLVAPQTAITEAFDVASNSLTRVTRLRLYYENYIEALSKDLGGATFFTFFGNSTLLVILNWLGHFFSVTVVAYAFARLRAPGKNILFIILLSTMMLPWPVMLIPQYEIFSRLKMINTLWPLFIRSFFGNAFLIFLLRQFFMGIPQELEDAARIDGANTLQVLWNVMLPLSKPALATIAIFTFWWTWNSFFEPYIYLSSPKNYTVSLGLGFFKSQYRYTFHLLMSASVVAILPIILIFFFAQRYFIEGIQLTGLKG